MHYTYHIGPKAQEIVNRDKDVISPSYPRGYPFVMESGSGVEVWDVDGKRYLDFAAGIAVVSTGHCHPAVVKAIQEQAGKFIHISSDFYHENWVRLAEKINEIAPMSNEVVSFMTNSGTEAVEAAIKLAQHQYAAHRIHRFFGSVPRPDDWIGHLYGQQTWLPPQFLSINRTGFTMFPIRTPTGRYCKPCLGKAMGWQ